MKKITVFLLTALLLIGALAPVAATFSSMASGSYEVICIKTFDEVGESFYPGCKTQEEVKAVLESPLGQDLIRIMEKDMIKKTGTVQFADCIVGYRDTPSGRIYTLINGDAEWGEWELSEELVEKSIAGGGMFWYVCRPTVPSTGDNTPIALIAGLLLLSGAGLVVLKKRGVR